MPACKLTVVIPTYNRPKQLAKTLGLLRSQLDESWLLIILDNCSDHPAQTVVDEAGLRNVPSVRVIRNIVNLGLTGNILRAFEVASTAWVAILADDDEVSSDYVRLIEASIERFHNAVSINFASSIHPRREEFVTEGLDDFLLRMDNWSNLLFISSSAFNRDQLIGFLRFGFIYAYSLAPFTAMVMQCLKETGGQVVFTNGYIVRHVEAEGETWPRVFLSNTVLLLELVPDGRSRTVFFGKMQPYFLSLPAIAARFIKRAAQTGEDHTFLFHLRVAFAKSMSRIPRSGARILALAVARPRLGAAMIKLTKTLLRRNPAPMDEHLHSGL